MLPPHGILGNCAAGCFPAAQNDLLLSDLTMKMTSNIVLLLQKFCFVCYCYSAIVIASSVG